MANPYFGFDAAPGEKVTAANPLPVTGGGVAQGSSTAAQTGSLVQGAVTTAAPTYTTGTTNPFSLATDGSLRVTSAVQGPVPAGAATATAFNMDGGEYRSTLPTLTNGQQGPRQLDANGNTRVRLIGYNVSGTDGVSNATVVTLSTHNEATSAGARPLSVAGSVFNGTTWDRNKKPSAVARLMSSAATTNATSAKASAGDVFTIVGENVAATVLYLKLYNKATAPTVGTDTPFLTLALKATSAFSFTFPALYFSTGIAYALTVGAADADTTAVAAGDILGLNIVYQ